MAPKFSDVTPGVHGLRCCGKDNGRSKRRRRRKMVEAAGLLFWMRFENVIISRRKGTLQGRNDNCPHKCNAKPVSVGVRRHLYTAVRAWLRATSLAMNEGSTQTHSLVTAFSRSGTRHVALSRRLRSGCRLNSKKIDESTNMERQRQEIVKRGSMVWLIDQINPLIEQINPAPS